MAKTIIQQTIDAVKHGHVFAVVVSGEDENQYYQSIFPAPMSEHSAIHTSKEDGWEYIVQIISIHMKEGDEYGNS